MQPINQVIKTIESELKSRNYKFTRGITDKGYYFEIENASSDDIESFASNLYWAMDSKIKANLHIEADDRTIFLNDENETETDINN